MDIGDFDTFFELDFVIVEGLVREMKLSRFNGTMSYLQGTQKTRTHMYDVFCEIKQVHIAEETMHKNSVA